MQCGIKKRVGKGKSYAIEFTGSSQGNNEKESQETADEDSKQRRRNIYHHRSVKSHQPQKTINTATNTFRSNQIHALTIRDMNFGERTAALGF